MSAGEIDVIAIGELKENNASTSEHNVKIEEKSVDASSGNPDMDQSKEENKCSDVSEAVTEKNNTLSSGHSPEVFNVCVRNIPKKTLYADFRSRVINALGFEPKKMKYHTKNNYAFLGLKDEEERQKVINTMNGLTFNYASLTCEKADHLKNPFTKKVKRRQNFHEEQSKRKKLSPDEDPEEKIIEAVCPYASKPYEEQLSLKDEEIRSFIQKVSDNLKGVVNVDGSKKGNSCLELLPIVQSPVLYNYRNKVEFKIGRGKDKSDNVVGFSLASNEENSFIIVEPTKCVNISLTAIQVGKEFQQFIQGLPYPSYDYLTCVGFWLGLMIRINTAGDIMIIIQINTSHLSTEEFDGVQETITDFYTSPERTIKVSAVFMQPSLQKNVHSHTFNHLAGEFNLKETFLGLQFRISPYSFFQINMSAAETLYKTICEWCHTEEDDTHILDIFCGIGTMGICIANSTSRHVTGIDVREEAIEDAKFNAVFNGMQNMNFVCGKAEDVIGDTLKSITSTNIVAVIDPSRSLMRRRVVETLRSCLAVKQVLYVISIPRQASDNLLSFCRPENHKLKGPPFKMVRALPFDLYPHSHHFELIIELVRT